MTDHDGVEQVITMAWRAQKQVKDAFLELGVPIFNLSFSFKPGVLPALGQVMDDLPQALFVVAAGNDWTTNESEGKLCEGKLVIYPQCWASKPNVIVVTGTNLEGNQLLLPVPRERVTDPGSNWHPQLVHLAAPGDGFFAAGNPDTYVRVRGSSFAAPLVTAAAAALYSAGVTDPVLIKQRLVATADRLPSLANYVLGGVLNAKRALDWVTKGVVLQGKQETVIALQRSSDLTIPNPGGQGSRQVPVRNVRRITRIGNKVRVIFATTSEWRENSTRVEVPDALHVLDVEPQSWIIKYREIDKVTMRESPDTKELNLGTVTDYVGPIIR